MMKKFSVLIAHYNNFEYFKACYQSLLNQSFDDFEVIIVDDCSTDDSFKNIKTLTQKDPRVRLYKNKENKGVGFTKRRCVELASGEVCGFLDSDDALADNAIELSLKKHAGDNVAVYSRFFFCEDNLALKMFPSSGAVKNGDQKFFNIFFEVNHFFSFKKTAYEKTSGINPDLSSAVDQDLYLKLYETGNFTFIKEPLYLYRKHKRGLSQDESKKEMLYKNWHQVILDAAKRRNIQSLYGKNTEEIACLPGFILKQQNHFLRKTKMKLQRWVFS